MTDDQTARDEAGLLRDYLAQTDELERIDRRLQTMAGDLSDIGAYLSNQTDLHPDRPAWSVTAPDVLDTLERYREARQRCLDTYAQLANAGIGKVVKPVQFPER